MTKTSFSVLIFGLVMIAMAGCGKSTKTNSNDPAAVDLRDIVLENESWYQDGKEEPFTGKGTSYYKTGQKQCEASFQNGKLHGLYMTYYPNGFVEQKIHYLNGLANDTTRTFYDNGQLEAQMLWKNGKENGKMIRYYDNGQVESEGKIFDGKEEGYWKFYYPNGIQKSFEIYQRGMLVDSSYSYYQNGKVASKGYFRDGLKEGRFVFYDSISGAIEGHQIFEKDVLISSSKNR